MRVNCIYAPYKKQPDKIQTATLRARAANFELKKIQQLKATGLISSSPNDPHYMKVLNRGNPITDARCAPAGEKLASTMNVRQTPMPPDKNQYTDANASSVASISNHWPHDPIHHMVSTMLEENWDMKSKDSIVVKTN